MKSKLIIALFLMIAFASCEEKKTIYPLNSSDNYFNFPENTVLHFTGDSINYNDFTHQRDSIRFFYVDSLITIDTSNNQTTYLFNRYVTYPNQTGITYLKNYSIIKRSYGILLAEDLKEYYLLPNLFDNNSTWNGHQYQSSDEQQYQIKSITNENYAGVNRTLLEVLMKDEFNLIAEDKASIKYAEGLGIIHIYHKNISKDIVTGVIKSGSIVNLVFIP